jgi:hypothetical protein
LCAAAKASTDVGCRNPTTGIAACCARAASGHAAAPTEQRDERAAFHSAPKPTLLIGTALGDFSRNSVNEKAI